MRTERGRRHLRRVVVQAVGAVGLLWMCGILGIGCEGCGCGTPTPRRCDPAPMSCISCARPEPCDAGPSDVGAPLPDFDADARVLVDAPMCVGGLLGVPCVEEVCDPTTALLCLPAPEAVLSDGATVALGEASCSRECDPEADTCGPCAGCSTELPFGSGRVYTRPVCRPRCAPSFGTPGDCPSGLTCDPRTALCVPSCDDDADCQYAPLSDGTFAPSTAGGLRCDRATGRCAHDTPDTLPTTGDGCLADTDCAAGHECSAAGVCTRFACEPPMRACPPEERCVPTEGSTSCRLACNTTGDCPGRTACDPNSNTCWATCSYDRDCTASEQCLTPTGRPCDGPPCFCAVDVGL